MAQRVGAFLSGSWLTIEQEMRTLFERLCRARVEVRSSEVDKAICQSWEAKGKHKRTHQCIQTELDNMSSWRRIGAQSALVLIECAAMAHRVGAFERLCIAGVEVRSSEVDKAICKGLGAPPAVFCIHVHELCE